MIVFWPIDSNRIKSSHVILGNPMETPSAEALSKEGEKNIYESLCNDFWHRFFG